MSHTSQLSLTVRYIYDGEVREDFLTFVDPHEEVFASEDGGIEEMPMVNKIDASLRGVHVPITGKADTSPNVLTEDDTDTQNDNEAGLDISDSDDDDNMTTEPKLTGKMLGNLVLKIMNKIGLAKKNCVGIGTDGCSVMASKVCGAVATIQSEAPQAIRCPCNNHSLNLSLARTSSVQSIRNAVGTVKDVISFFNASEKRNFVMKHFAGKQLQSLCETRWIERHDSLLQFCNELRTIVRALKIISSWDDTESSRKANTLKVALCNCDLVVSLFSLCDILSLTLPVSRLL